MTTLTVSPAAVDTSRLSGHVPLATSIRQTLLMAWRALVKMRRNPEQFFDVVVQPLLFTPMFAVIFGGAISGDVKAYLPLLVPGVLVQTALTTCMQTGVTLREDMEKGVFDRFRSLPMSRMAPLAGPALADTLRYAIATVLTIAVGLVMGYRPGGGVVGVIAGGLVIVVTSWSLAWIFTYLGTVMKSAQGLQGVSMMILFPLTFLSNAYVPVDTMPSWLKEFVKFNPVSHIVSAVRSLMNDGRVTGELGWGALGCAVIVIVFAALSVRSLRRAD
ncbi:ABC-2 type transporter [Nostocoides japonicum T1-X7]|uniref:Transport permease protein n=1 Tax=Nostocoides japonicum T1-X7 TaxID=1194083 RepID=A0A077M8F2_9MICO|nr:ABC transporter permease [Tetrasphaera japonica]CCH80334.1 ABC-2 type transporter [Tetrasphaera japonica T1-X7]